MKRKGYRGPVLAGLGLAVTMILAIGVGAWGLLGATIAQGPGTALAAVQAAVLANGVPVITINGNIGANAIQIDDLDNSISTSPNANVDTGTSSNTDGPLGTAADCEGVQAGEVHSNCPPSATGTGGSYVDWNNLAPGGSIGGAVVNSKFVIGDPSGNTDDSFAGTSTASCLQPDHAAPNKQDLRAVFLADNNQGGPGNAGFLYVGIVDENDPESSRHVLVFHANQVQAATDTCAGNGHQLTVDLDNGDKLLKVIFRPPVDEPPVTLYTYSESPANDTLVDLDTAFDFSDTTHWTAGTSADVPNYAVNTTAITNDNLGDLVPSLDASRAAQTFGEVAVAKQSLGVPVCGGEPFLSIVTRTTGTGAGTNKDWIGAKYQFPSLTATASLTPTCGLDIGFSGTATGPSGTDVTETANWAWNFTPNTTPDTPGGVGVNDGTVTAGGAGSYSATATVSFQGCQLTVPTNTVVVYPPIDVNPTMAGSCDATGSWTFDAQPSSGTGTQACSWTFTNTNTTRTHSPTSSSAESGSGTTTRGDANPDTINGSVTCTETGRADSLTCSDSGTASAIVYAPLQVSIAASPDTRSCNVSEAGIGQGITYDATVSGGVGPYSYDWAVSQANAAGANCGDPAAADNDPAGTANCTADPPDDDFCALVTLQVTVDDTIGACAAVTSEQETVTKTTSISGTNN